MKKNKAVIEQIRQLATEKLPKSVHIYLYGSRARGDSKEDSDWDILVVLDKDKIEQTDYDSVTYPLTALGWSLGEMIIPVMYTKDEWQSNSFTPFYKNVEQEKILLV